MSGERGSASGSHRFGVLDGWRGIAALAVALYHFRFYSHIGLSSFLLSAYLFVDFFLVLSGFVIAYTYGDRLARWGDVAEFAIRRFGRLWPLHAAVLMMLLLLELLRAYLTAWLDSFRRTAVRSGGPAQLGQRAGQHPVVAGVRPERRTDLELSVLEHRRGVLVLSHFVCVGRAGARWSSAACFASGSASP